MHLDFAERQTSLQKNAVSRDFLTGMKLLAAGGCLLILLYSMRFWASGQLLRIFGVGMLVAGAALLTGFLLGFVFAIPRLGDHSGKMPMTSPERTQTPESGAQPDPVKDNANLVEISDWLTKIIVGVGLVELHSIAGALGKLSYYLAPGLQPAACTGGPSCADPVISGQAAGLAILIFYFTLGFLMGYVWTMIFFKENLTQQLKQENWKLESRVNKVEQKNNTLEWFPQALLKMMQTEVSAGVAPKISQAKLSDILSAEAFLNANEVEMAMASIDEVLKADPQNGSAIMTKARIFKRLALRPGQTNRDELLNQAIVYTDQAIALLPHKGEPLYNKACYQALLDLAGLKGEVLENLKSAISLNPALRQTAKADDDLATLRQDADFIKLVGREKSSDA